MLQCTRMKSLLQAIRRDLNKRVDRVYKAGAIRFFKEDVNPLGVRTKDTRAIAATYWKEVKTLPKEELFTICEALMKKGTMEETLIAFAWLRRVESKLVISDFATFERWLKTYVSNWAHCDEFCTHALGSLIYQYPALKKKTFAWTRSKNRWLRRAAAVTLIYPFRQPKPDLTFIFKVADALLEDEDDLVQKGYGWMLKVAADHNRDEVFDYVMKRKDRMPRTALRYAIEKMPRAMREKAMK